MLVVTFYQKHWLVTGRRCRWQPRSYRFIQHDGMGIGAIG